MSTKLAVKPMTLRGWVAGGSIVKGVLNVGQGIEIRAGIV